MPRNLRVQSLEAGESGREDGSPFQYSCRSHGQGAWRGCSHGVTESSTTKWADTLSFFYYNPYYSQIPLSFINDSDGKSVLCTSNFHLVLLCPHLSHMGIELFQVSKRLAYFQFSSTHKVWLLGVQSRAPDNFLGPSWTSEELYPSNGDTGGVCNGINSQLQFRAGLGLPRSLGSEKVPLGLCCSVWWPLAMYGYVSVQMENSVTQSH